MSRVAVVGMVKDNVVVEVKMGSTEVSAFIPVEGIRMGIDYIEKSNLSDDSRLTIMTDEDGFYVLVKETGKLFWCQNPQLTNFEPTHVTITVHDMKEQLQKFGLL